MDHELDESSAPLGARVDTVIEASPEVVYDLVTDITDGRVEPRVLPVRVARH